MRGRPDDELLRRALRNWAFVVPRPDARTAPTEVRLALDWVARASRPLAGMYYAGLRPAEAVAVSPPDCDLPAAGWGSAVLHATRPSAGKKWTDSGRNHVLRGLKSRPPSDTPAVPLPPELVRLWRESVDTFGTAEGGRLFFNEKGGIVGSSTYDRAWHEARELALPPGPGGVAPRRPPLRPAALGPVHLAEHRRRSH